MLSINVPVYNIDVKDLVLEIINQTKELNVSYEIRVYDDGSVQEIKDKNRWIAEFPNVVYHEMEENLGRSAIRNKLGFDSRFQYLLFMDADSKPVNNDYIKKYLEKAQPGSVLCGGTAYQSQKPSDSGKLLRWFYGIKREAISAEARSNGKGFIITSNNFLIEKAVFEQIHFREDVKNYGHEDTLLGYDLSCKGIKIIHINNPLEHTGIENSDVFLEKSKESLQSLFYITNELIKWDKEFVQQVSFLNRYKQINRIIPAFVLRMIFSLMRRGLEQHLMGKNPRMFWFDVYKLTFFSTLKNREQ